MGGVDQGEIQETTPARPRAWDRRLFGVEHMSGWSLLTIIRLRDMSMLVRSDTPAAAAAALRKDLEAWGWDGRRRMSRACKAPEADG
jgi:hypothetical protein